MELLGGMESGTNDKTSVHEISLPEIWKRVQKYNEVDLLNQSGPQSVSPESKTKSGRF